MADSPCSRLLARGGLACYGAWQPSERRRMSQPIRVEGWAYTPGARVSLRLRFRSQSTYARVRAEFHNPSGGVIKLEGVTHPREESGAAHTEVVLTGKVPENAALGTYECRSVEARGVICSLRALPRQVYCQRGLHRP